MKTHQAVEAVVAFHEGTYNQYRRRADSVSLEAAIETLKRFPKPEKLTYPEVQQRFSTAWKEDY